MERKRVIKTIGNIRLCECFYQNKACYGIEKAGVQRITIFDYDDTVREELEKIFGDGASIQFYYNNTMRLQFSKQGIVKEVALAKYLYCLYHSIEVSDVTGQNVLRKEQDMASEIDDCRSCNLYCGSVRVEHEYKESTDGNIILETLVLESNKHGFRELFDPKGAITDIVNGRELIFNWTAGYNRLLCEVRGTEFRFPISHLAFLAYYADITPDNYITALKQFKEHNTQKRLSIEHLDGDYRNHRRYNLALVDEGLNSKKNDKVSRIKEPNCFAVVYSEGKYKIVVGELEDNLLGYRLFSAKEFATVVDFLNIYIELYPEKVYQVKELNQNKKIFNDAVFRKSVANTPIKRFAPLDY